MINDIDYQDYRELVCFERPATVLLHYQHNWTYARLFLFDRFHFSWKDKKLISNSNTLADFLKNEGLAKQEHLMLKDGTDTRSILNAVAPSSENEAIVWPYQNIVGSTHLASTWILQQDVNLNPDNLDVSSLRGDNFYLRKSISKNEISESTLVENSGVNIFRIKISNEFLKNRPNSETEAISKFNISENIQLVQSDFCKRQAAGEILGAEALQKAFSKMQKVNSYWEGKVQEGFKNVLLVELFWPIQFSYQPFLVFWKYLFRLNAADNLMDIASHTRAKEILSRIQSNAEILTNLGNLFGAMPKAEMFEKFCKVLQSTIDSYAEFENIFLNSSPQKKDKIFLIDANKGTENIVASLVKENFLPVQKFSPDTKSYSLSEYGKTLELEHNKITDFNAIEAQNKYHLRLRTSGSDHNVKYAYLSDDIALPEVAPLPLPFIIKPNFGFASCHVSMVSSNDEFLSKAHEIRRFNRLVIKPKNRANTGVLCEELISGEEIAVDSLTVNGKTKVFGIFTREYVNNNNFQDFIYRIDADYVKQNSAHIEKAVNQVLHNLDYQHGPSHIEFRKDKDGKLKVIDAAFRMGGMGQMGALIEATSSTPYIKLVVLAACKRLDDKVFNEINHIISRSGCFFVPEAKSFGRIKHISGEDFLKSDQRIIHFSYLKSVGETIAAYPDGADYAALVLGVTKTSQELDQLLEDLKSQVRVSYDL